jgi:ribosome-binding factor A
VNESLREVLSDAVSDLQDPRIGFVTLTEVRASPDLRHATVYVSVLGSEAKRTRALAGLEASRGVLQARINRELRLKRTPQLAFEYDRAIDRGARLSKLLDDLSSDRDGDGAPRGR